MLPGVADLLLVLRLRLSIVCGALGSNCVRAVLLMLERTLVVESASAAFLLAVCSGTRCIKRRHTETPIMAEVDFSRIYSATYSNVSFCFLFLCFILASSVVPQCPRFAV